MSKLYKEMLAALNAGRHVERITDLETGDEALMVDGTIRYGGIIENGLVEKIVAEPTLILFGAGHVSKALYDLAMLQRMRIIVLDDRSEVLTEERFPLAERHIAPFGKLLEEEYDALSPYFVIFTHGHSYDLEALRYALSHKFSYLGMIGSKAKSASQIESVRKEGFPEERINAIHSPIGIKINAVTPEEIAVSIMAEIIGIYRKDKDAVSLDSSLIGKIADGKGITVRIIAKQGSAPRSVGSTMFVTETASYSTIGGGNVESIAIAEARRMIRENKRREILSLNLGRGGNAGMICGGSVSLLLADEE